MKAILIIILFISSRHLVFGQTEFEYYSELLSKKKFDEYKVAIKCEIGPIAKSIIWNELEALPKSTKSNILHQFKASDNFIGSCHKYAIWGCGSPCQMLAVFEISSGKLIGTINASLGFEIQTNSRLIISNPPTSQKFDFDYRQAIGQPRFYELIDGRIMEIQK